jgi:hypothetical protein
MSSVVIALGFVGAVCLWAALRRRSEGDGAWAVLVPCTRCGDEMPRWFFLDKGSARGPYGRYRYPIPSECRVCRHHKGIEPLRPLAGETEAQYRKRSEKITAEVVASRMG